MAISIILADDHKMMRAGLRDLLDKQQNFNVIGEADDGKTTVQMAKKLKPDVVILDINMPDLNGIDTAYQVLQENPLIKIIALSAYADRQYVMGILKAGAMGYILKENALEELCLAINDVVNDRIALSSTISRNVIKDYIESLKTETDSSVFNILTTREREVLQLIAEGNNTKEIAKALFISTKTVESHRKKLMDKLGINDTVGLVKYAIKEGLIKV